MWEQQGFCKAASRHPELRTAWACRGLPAAPPPGGICYGCRALQGLREGPFHLSGIYPHVPAVSPHNFQNEGPLVTAKETGNVHLPPLGAAESSTHSQAGPEDHFITMAGTQASNRGPTSYRSRCCRKSVSNSCE